MCRQGESKVTDEGITLSSPFFVLAGEREGKENSVSGM